MTVSALRTIAIVLLVAASQAHAQSPGGDASAIVARMRAIRAEQRTHAIAARIAITTQIEIRDEGSTVDLIAPQTIVHEASGEYHRDPTVGARIRIAATRGTAPLSGIARGPIENFQTLGEIVEIGDDEIVLLNTAFVSPLAPDAGEHYRFTYEGVEKTADGEVDVVHFAPLSTLRPSFDGRLYVRRERSGGSLHGGPAAGSLAALRMTPSATSAIPFVESLAIEQQFAPDGSGAVRRMTVEGRGAVTAVAFGLAETIVDFRLATELTDRRIDAPMSDSLRVQSDRIVVRDDAADVAATYWASRGSLTQEQVATIEASRASVAARPSLAFTFGGMIDYNRAGGATPTLSAGAALGPVGVAGSGGYSFGLDRPVGEGTLTLSFGDQSTVLLSVRGGAFSQIATAGFGDRSYPRIMNTLVAATLHQDYYNFLRKDGWSAGADVGYGRLRLAATYERSRQFSIGNNAKWAILTWASKDFQPNPPVTEGRHATMQAELAFSRVAPFLKLTPVGDDDFRWSIAGLRGTRTGTDTSFELVEALASYSIPIARTGYNPITVTLLGAAGTGSATLPPQYQFRLRTSAASFGKPGGFVSPPKGVYGGTEYVAAGAEINLTDLPWRAIGLPTVNGRGIELIVAGAAARYRQSHPIGYRGTGDLWYGEAGLALSRIPLFLTEIVYGRVDFRQGIGPLGQFGGNFTFVLPL